MTPLEANIIEFKDKNVEGLGGDFNLDLVLKFHIDTSADELNKIIEGDIFENKKEDERKLQNVEKVSIEREEKISKKYSFCVFEIILRIFKCFLLRLCLIFYSLLIVYFEMCSLSISSSSLARGFNWLLVIPIFLMVLDTLYVCLWRKGVEFDW